jgi:hypothetical protein
MSLGMFAARFGDFVRDTHIPVDDSEPGEFSHDLHDLRDAVGHHLIPLLLIARSDRDFAQSERDVIVSYCAATAARHGFEFKDTHAASLHDYITSYRPTLMQLDTAIARLEHGNHDEFVALVDAARELVEVDGVSRSEELKFLSRLQDELQNPTVA